MAGATGSELLLDVDQARRQLLSNFSPVGEESVIIGECLGRILARPVVSDVDLPLFTHSSMDGFAVRAVDLQNAQTSNPTDLPVIEDIPAGSIPQAVLQPRQAARIMTGAMLPHGADAVVPVEYTDHFREEYQPGSRLPERIKVFRTVHQGDFIRVRGQDIKRGAQVLSPGLRLRPRDLGLLAMLGIDQIPVYRKPRIALFSTGDELVPVDQPLAPGLIHDSNAYTLAASITNDGGEAIYLGIAGDREDEVESLLETAAERNVDLVISTAGVSVGAFDFVREVVRKRGQLDFWRVNMRPGKPLAFGSYQGIPFVGLPGNPVSAFVGYEVFIRPAVIKMSGYCGQFRRTKRVKLGEEIESDGRESYLRARLQVINDQLVAHLTGHQGSGNIFSLVQANALLIIPSGVKSLPINAEVEAWILDEDDVVKATE